MTHHNKVPKAELDRRLAALRGALSARDPGWQMAILCHKLNLYYLTGTMQEGALVLTPDTATFWVRRLFDRARAESNFADLRPMKSFRVLEGSYEVPDTVWLEGKTATLDWLGLVRKYLPFREYRSLSPLMADLRAVKSPYELDCMRRAGRIHSTVLDTVLPSLIQPGMSEADLCAAVYRELLRRGAMGISRFNNPLGEDVAGIVSFGESALCAGAMDSPSGTVGTCLAMPAIGAATRLLRPGDLILLDIPSGQEGYHTDKSVVLLCGALTRHPNAERIRRAYDCCVEIEQFAADRLRAGAIPEEIYLEALRMVPEEFAEGFMNGCKFLGHSIGLTMDESPVLARSFTAPLVPGMTLAIEPKIALPGVGMVGTENTYEVTPDGPAACLTGGPQPLRTVCL